MSKLKLIYFPVKGRSQTIRYLLEDTEIDYEYEAIAIEKWTEYKDKTMFGHLPELKVGDVTISQTGAIMRYLARKYGLYGNDDSERAQMDMVWELYADLFTDMGRMLYAGEKHVEEKAKFLENLPTRLKKFEKMLMQNEEGKGFFVGSKPSYADYAALDILHNMQLISPGSLDVNEPIKSYYDHMCARSRINSFMNRDDIKNMNVTISGNL